MQVYTYRRAVFVDVHICGMQVYTYRCAECANV